MITANFYDIITEKLNIKQDQVIKSIVALHKLTGICWKNPERYAKYANEKKKRVEFDRDLYSQKIVSERE